MTLTTTAQLLAAYDDQLRGDAAEALSAASVTWLGPLRLATYTGGRGFVTYPDLGGADEAGVAVLVADALAHYVADARITRVEWKTRGHDHAPGLHDVLLANGFVMDEPESIMIGEARHLAVDTPLPDGVTLRRVSREADVRAMCEAADVAFGTHMAADMTAAMLRRLTIDPTTELWVAEHGGTVVSTGRLEPVAGTEFAGIWGGSTLPEWRGQGIYRALTAARARSALAAGKTLINSDSTEYSRPILERSGFVKVSTTTPYEWRRGPRASGE
ncbi:GCN5-related protein N-acetyltransferase [Beutenbergia cavernae DSM 12333]|uniref:GCN5-related protein N-acetyltransferase n=1 Tax=Beutenbergia cavernae (strain ATCC BAA-8 / DSM 12333 / CCUG 43141 / JCM 11478 / NBRC 16432 / NCIMB 13614 / HKI 0122) TaxID=471853 RepID=C5C3C6_BEUC1|nr:GNAT family N-acetyltransferase [Beutenbergia cavernae]ACQ79825.1 GCN5-related protein N-acetyltransferase [Beutenbergia cavernae DSM 12333]